MKSQTCFDLHKRKTKSEKSTCGQYFKRKNCDQIVNMKLHKRSHECGEHYCQTCKDFFADDQQCYVQPVDGTINRYSRRYQNKSKYIYFDFESTQDCLLQFEEGYRPDKREGKAMIRNRYNYPTPPIRDQRERNTNTK